MTHDVMTMTRLNIRLKRWWIVLWSLALGGFVSSMPPAYLDYYPTLESRRSFVLSMKDNVGAQAMYGRLELPGTIGQLCAWEGGSWVTVLACVMTVVMSLSLHRSAEETHTAEIARATGLASGSSLLASITTTVIASLSIGACNTVGMLLARMKVEELTVSGSVAYGISVFLASLGAALVAMGASMLSNEPASIKRWGLLSIAVTYIIRAIADVKEKAWLNWFSPQGWRALISPYRDNDWASACALSIICLVVISSLFYLERKREYGIAILKVNSPKSPKPRDLSSVLRLRRILDRPTFLGWSLAVLIMSLFFSSMVGSIKEALEGADEVGIAKELLNSSNLEASYIGYCSTFISIVIASAMIQLVVHQVSEERRRTIDLLRSCGVSRETPLKITAISAWISSALLVLIASFAAAAGSYYPAENSSSVLKASFLSFGFQYAAVVALGGFAVLVVGISPQLGKLAWLPVIFSAFVAMLGKMFHMPDLVLKLSVFNHLVLTDTIKHEWPYSLGMLLIGLVFTLVGCKAFAHREIP